MASRRSGEAMEVVCSGRRCWFHCYMYSCSSWGLERRCLGASIIHEVILQYTIMSNFTSCVDLVLLLPPCATPPNLRTLCICFFFFFSFSYLALPILWLSFKNLNPFSEVYSLLLLCWIMWSSAGFSLTPPSIAVTSFINFLLFNSIHMFCVAFLRLLSLCALPDRTLEEAENESLWCMQLLLFLFISYILKLGSFWHERSAKLIIQTQVFLKQFKCISRCCAESHSVVKLNLL